jgi:hypothetical protein
MLSVTLAAWHYFIKRQQDGANLDKIASRMLADLPFLNRHKRRQIMRAMRARNSYERERQGFGPRGSWFGLTHRSRFTVKLSTPDADP